MIPFPPPAFEAYQAYNRFRPECATPKIFINLKTRQPMSKFAVNSVCDHLHKRLKLSKKLTPHLLRHTYATHLHLKGQPIEHINALLGHESLNTTLDLRVHRRRQAAQFGRASLQDSNNLERKTREMNRDFVRCTYEPGNVGTRETRVSI